MTKWLVGTLPSLWIIQEVEGKQMFLILYDLHCRLLDISKSVEVLFLYMVPLKPVTAKVVSSSSFYNELSLLLPNLQNTFLEFILLSWSTECVLDCWDFYKSSGLLFENIGQELIVKTDILFWVANFAWQFRKINVTFWNEPEQQMLLKNVLRSEIFQHNLL